MVMVGGESVGFSGAGGGGTGMADGYQLMAHQVGGGRKLQHLRGP
jgi:hypothetical protein